jgi:hypothetical protein
MGLTRKLPDGYVAPSEWPEFKNIITIPSFLYPKKIGHGRDMAWCLWPFSFETYHSDTEPVFESSAPFSMPFRIVMWHRETYTHQKPKGWVAFRKRPESLIGFTDIQGVNEYDTLWSEGARRDKKTFFTKYSSAFSIEKAGCGEFEKAYLMGTIRPILKHILVQSEVKLHAKKNPEQTTFWVARRRSDKKIMAGMAILDSPTNKASYYLAGFYLKESRKIPLMTSIVDTWFNTSQKKGIRFMHFGVFYQPGDPASWKGYSNFKAKFGVQYVARPPVLFKWI